MTLCIDHQPLRLSSNPDLTGRRTPTPVRSRGAAERLTPFDVALAGSRRLTIANVGTATTVADLARIVGLPDVFAAGGELHALLIDGQPVALAQRLLGTGIRHGSRIEAVPISHVAAESAKFGERVVEAVWLTGPDAGAAIQLGVGSHVVGRSTRAAVRCNDRSIELHHALIEVRPDGSVRYTQLAGVQPILVESIEAPGEQPAAAGINVDRVLHEVDQTCMPVGLGVRIRFGASVLVIRPVSDAAVDDPAANFGREQSRSSGGDQRCIDPWRTPLLRRPRPLSDYQPAAIEVPRRTPQSGVFGGALWPTLIGLAGAAAMAVVFDQLMFLMFGALGALVAAGTWAVQKLGVVRSRRSASREYAEAVETFVGALATERLRVAAAHRDSVPTLEASVRSMHGRSSSLWAVRRDDPDAFRVSLGEGELVWQPNVTGLDRETSASTWASIDQASRLTRMPVVVSLGEATVTALVGTAAASVARSMIVQLAAASGPADWRLAVITDSAGDWDCLRWLPHIIAQSGDVLVSTSAGSAELLSPADDDPRHLVVVLDHPELLSTRTSALRRALASGRSIAVLVVCEDEAAVPAVATSSLIIGRQGRSRWIADTRVTALAEAVNIAGISADGAFAATASIACLIDPELIDTASGLASRVELIDLLRSEIGDAPAAFGHRIAAQWEASGPDPSPSAPIGLAADGVVELDLAADGPHGLIAGTTGSGKSELLRSLVIGLAVRHSPEQITFVLVDYKGGSTFDGCAELPHVVGVVTDLDENLAARALRSLEAELRRRERILRDVGASDLAMYRASGLGEPLPRLVVIIDEFAALSVAQPDFVGALLGVAQRGRSLGVHLLLATQRPSGVVSDDIKANTNLRIALRVQDRNDALDVIGDSAAASLARSTPGRAIMRLGADELVVFQTASCTGPESDLKVLVQSTRLAAELNSIEPPHRPWLPPLGDGTGSGPSSGADQAAIGLIDDPDHQRFVPLRWVPDDGHLLLLGAIGSGTTTALLAIVTAVARHAAVDFFVIDAMGDARIELMSAVPGCVAVVRIHETERLLRMLHLLVAETTRRKFASPDEQRRDAVVVIDGLGALRAELESLDLYDEIGQLETLVADGRVVGLSIVASAVRPIAVSSAMLGQIGNRWVFNLDEPLDASVVGVRAAMVPGPIPGRLIESRSGRVAQIDIVHERILHDLACRTEAETEMDTTSTAPSAASRWSADRQLGVLATTVDWNDLGPGSSTLGEMALPIGRSFESLDTIAMPVAAGEHMLVIGPSRSGRSTTLATIARSWQRLHPAGVIVSIAPRRNSARAGLGCADLAGVLDALASAGESARLVVIDDAEMVDDPTGAFAALIASRVEGLTVVAAGRADSLRASYGHWTMAVRRSRLGIVMASSSDLDADLLAVSLPRRVPIAVRPGLAWMVGDGARHLVQIATLDVAR